VENRGIQQQGVASPRLDTSRGLRANIGPFSSSPTNVPTITLDEHVPQVDRNDLQD
jgi:hypothetical protein